MPTSSVRPASLPLQWQPSAKAAYRHSLNYIGAQDQHALELLVQRIERALSAIQSQPDIGTLVRRGVRRFPIPKTGHVIDYRVTKSEIRITRWARQKRKA